MCSIVACDQGFLQAPGDKQKRMRHGTGHLAATLITFQQLGDRNASLQKGFGLLKGRRQQLPASTTPLLPACPTSHKAFTNLQPPHAHTACTTCCAPAV